MSEGPWDGMPVHCVRALGPPGERTEGLRGWYIGRSLAVTCFDLPMTDRAIVVQWIFNGEPFWGWWRSPVIREVNLGRLTLAVVRSLSGFAIRHPESRRTICASRRWRKFLEEEQTV